MNLCNAESQESGCGFECGRRAAKAQAPVPARIQTWIETIGANTNTDTMTVQAHHATSTYTPELMRCFTPFL